MLPICKPLKWCHSKFHAMLTFHAKKTGVICNHELYKMYIKLVKLFSVGAININGIAQLLTATEA